jgi:hypothetical protein
MADVCKDLPRLLKSGDLHRGVDEYVVLEVTERGAGRAESNSVSTAVLGISVKGKQAVVKEEESASFDSKADANDPMLVSHKQVKAILNQLLEYPQAEQEELERLLVHHWRALQSSLPDGTYRDASGSVLAHNATCVAEPVSVAALPTPKEILGIADDKMLALRGPGEKDTHSLLELALTGATAVLQATSPAGAVPLGIELFSGHAITQDGTDLLFSIGSPNNKAFPRGPVAPDAELMDMLEQQVSVVVGASANLPAPTDVKERLQHMESMLQEHKTQTCPTGEEKTKSEAEEHVDRLLGAVRHQAGLMRVRERLGVLDRERGAYAVIEPRNARTALGLTLGVFPETSKVSV